MSDFPGTASKPSHRGGPSVADGMLIVPTSSKSLLVYALGDRNNTATMIDVYRALVNIPPTMTEMREMSDHRFSQSLQRSDRVEPPVGQKELFRRNASVGSIERFPDGSRNSNVWSDDSGGSIATVTVKSAPAQDPGGRPWELYQVVRGNHLGLFGKVQWIQRIDTSARESTYIFFGEVSPQINH
jgi:hypothetical protein